MFKQDNGNAQESKSYLQKRTGQDVCKSKIIMRSKLDEKGKDGTSWDEFYLTPAGAKE
jgi:hypothetical protein